MGRSVEVVAMVRREKSAGLRGYLRLEATPGLSDEDVRERAFQLEFALDATGAPGPADIVVRLDSPCFEPRSQTKKLRVPPQGDSTPCTFLITPQITGELVASLELLNAKEQIAASRSIRMRAIAEGPVRSSITVVLTIPLEVVVRRTGALVAESFATAEEGTNTSREEREDITGMGVAIETADGADVPAANIRGDRLLGRTFSRYRVLEILGKGGMGLVYKVKDLELGHFVALKFLPRSMVSQHEALQRLRREACVASSLKHPNICAVYELGESDGVAFIVMEFLDGQTLRGCLSSGTLRGAGSASQVANDKLLDIAIQVSDGLAAAHENGVVHRDIKPENIFITRQGIAKILDFGLARTVVSETDSIIQQNAFAAASRQSSDSLSGSNFSVVRSGLVGSLSYMSPEQVRGELLDERTDLFSFGLVLYEMATGRRAFKGDSSGEPALSIANEAPIVSPRKLNPGISADLERIITKAVQKPRKLRYQSATEMRADLEHLKADEAKLSSLQPAAERWGWLVAIAIVIAIAIAGWFYWR